MSRSFSGLLAVAAGVVSAAAVLAVTVGMTIGACATAVVPRVARTACARDAWDFAWAPWLVLGVAVTVGVALPLGGAWSFHRQAGRARRRLARLLRARIVDSGRVLTQAEAVGLGDVSVVAAPQPLAVTRGLLRPSVVLSEGLVERLSDEQLRAVLCHEAEHVRRRDPLRLALARAAAAALWPFPVARDLAEHAELESELSADRAATARVGLRPLAGALRELLDSMAEDRSDAALSSIGGMRHRVEFLGTGDGPAFRTSRRRVVVSIVSGVLLGAVAAAFMVTLVRVGVWS